MLKEIRIARSQLSRKPIIDLRFGDCLEILPNLLGNSINMIFTDLPYGISKDSGYVNNSPDKKDYIAKYGKHKIDFGEWDTKSISLNILAEEYFRVLVDGGVAVIFYDIWATGEIRNAFIKFKQPRVLEWVKTNPVTINSKLNILSNVKEYMFSFVKKSNPVYNGSYHNGVFVYPICHGKERTEHPTQKPEKLCEEIIKLYSNENGIILDSCMGSGTTGVACKNLNRSFIGIEKDEKYFEIAQKRIMGY